MFLCEVNYLNLYVVFSVTLSIQSSSTKASFDCVCKAPLATVEYPIETINAIAK